MFPADDRTDVRQLITVGQQKGYLRPDEIEAVRLTPSPPEQSPDPVRVYLRESGNRHRAACSAR